MKIEDRKPLSNCYVFAKVMNDRKDLCKRVVELALDKKISKMRKLETESEQSSVVTRAVRFDVYLEADGSHIVLEMQANPEPLLAMRDRYYHAWLDKRALPKGKILQKLAKACVIFICNFDPLKTGVPIYDIQRYANARGYDTLMPYEDGARTIILNTKGDLTQTSPEVAELLKYIDTGECIRKSGLTWDLDRAIDKAYEDEEWVRGMGIIEVSRATRERDIAEKVNKAALEKGRAEGRAEGEARGETSERARQAMLLEALTADGRGIEDLAEAIMNDTIVALYEEYGIK